MDVKLASLDQALAGFAELVAADMGVLEGVLEPYLIDGLQNGKAQKFEYTLEQCWKTIKLFLRQCEGIDEASPKKIVKAFYLNEYLVEEDYMNLMQAIDDRNKLSHIYDQAEFNRIISRLPVYADMMQRIAHILHQECRSISKKSF